MTTKTTTSKEKQIWEILESVKDPEIPVISVVDLGIVRDVKILESNVVVTITPTYSGCPAMSVIRLEITTALLDAGFENIKIKTVLSPAWTTQWMSEKGKKALKEYGIAPPMDDELTESNLFGEMPPVECPHCGSKQTTMTNRFGSTPCKSLHQCRECKEPFDYFKCH
nr:phenylacetate-CoA oxygenase subunit PaaJ [Saprospiraceae bacterium]